MSGGRDIRQDLRKKPTGGVELIAVYTKGHPGYHSSVLRRSRREDSTFSNASYNDDIPSASYLSTPSLGSPGYRNNSRSENSSGKSMIGGKTIRDTGWYNIEQTDDSNETIDGVGPFQDTTRSTLRYSAGKIGHTQRKHTNSNVSYDTKTIVPKYPVGRDIGLTEAALLWMKVRARRGKHQADTRFFQEEDEAGYDMECAEERYCTMREKVTKFEKEAFEGQRRFAYDAEYEDEEGVDNEKESLVSLNISGIKRWRSVTGSGKVSDSRINSSFSQSGLEPSARSATRGSRYKATSPHYRASERIFSIGPSLSDVGSICPGESASNIGMPPSYRR